MSDNKIVKEAKDLLVGNEVDIAIVGSRSFNTFEQLTIMDEFIRSYTSISKIKAVISGGAYGADTLGKMWADANNKHIVEYLPDWKMYGNAAGFIRNKLIIKNADIVFAFWDGKSKGTKHSIKIAKEMRKELHIHVF